MTIIRLPLPQTAVNAACLVASRQSAEDIETGVQQERERVLELITIARQAHRFNIDVDIGVLIATGATPDSVRAAILDLASTPKGDHDV